MCAQLGIYGMRRNTRCAILRQTQYPLKAMTTLLARMADESARRREAARVMAYRRLRAALSELLPPGSEVWVFGSVLKPGRFREDSDVDIAVVSLPAGRSEAWLQSELGLRLERPVDVLNLNETGLRAKIEKEGERWTL